MDEILKLSGQDRIINEKKQTKLKYLQRETIQLREHIKNLEEVLTYNKQTLKIVLTKDEKFINSKELIEAMQTENESQKKMIDKYIKERNHFQGKVNIFLKFFF